MCMETSNLLLSNYGSHQTPGGKKELFKDFATECASTSAVDRQTGRQAGRVWHGFHGAIDTPALSCHQSNMPSMLKTTRDSFGFHGCCFAILHNQNSTLSHSYFSPITRTCRSARFSTTVAYKCCRNLFLACLRFPSASYPLLPPNNPGS